MDEDGPSPVAVNLEAGWRDALDDPTGLCRGAVGAALQRTVGRTWLADGEVGILLTDDASVQRLNAAYRAVDQPTDVLSFPALDLEPGADPGERPPTPVFLGDIVLAEETVREEAAAGGKPLGAHLCHLVVHGTLHLLGFDHQDEAQARVMERLEAEILADLGFGDPYAGAGSTDDAEALEATS